MFRAVAVATDAGIKANVSTPAARRKMKPTLRRTFNRELNRRKESNTINTYQVLSNNKEN